MFDRAIALCPCQIDIGERHVVLEIDKAFFGVRPGNDIEHSFRVGRTANGSHILPRCCWDKRLRDLVPVERAARLHVEVDDGCKSARDRKQIGIPTLRFAIDQRGYTFQTMARAFGRQRNGIVVDGKAAVRSGGGWPCV